jgi:hypothetical protein
MIRVLALVAVIAGAAVMLGQTAAAVGAPPQDSFSGSVVAGTGAYAGTRGSVSIVLVPGVAAGGSQPVVVALSPLACRPAGRRCLALRGRANGAMVAVGKSVPDVGRTLRVTAAGRIGPVGNVAVTGMIHATGFIAHGHELLRFVLRGAHGSVTISATSALVAGFTSP